MVTTTTKRGNFGLEYLLDGPRAEVLAEIEALGKRYPTEGYGTMVKSSVEKDGNMRATVWRAASCD